MLPATNKSDFGMIKWKHTYFEVEEAMRVSALDGKDVQESTHPNYNRELKHGTFLSHGRQPEVNISHARTLVSPRFLN